MLLIRRKLMLLGNDTVPLKCAELCGVKNFKEFYKITLLYSCKIHCARTLDIVKLCSFPLTLM